MAAVKVNLGAAMERSREQRREVGNILEEDHIRGVEASTIGEALVSVTLIDPSPFQPRIKLDEDRIEALAENIKEVGGLMQPILLRPKEEGRFELVVGERRWRAFIYAGYREIPANVRHLSDQDAFKMCASENLQRENLTQYEVAKMLQRLMDDVCKSKTELARVTGLSRTSVIVHLKFSELPSEILEMLEINPALFGTGYVENVLEMVEEGKLALVLRGLHRVVDGKLTMSRLADWVRSEGANQPSLLLKKEYRDTNNLPVFSVTQSGKRLSISSEDPASLTLIQGKLDQLLVAYLAERDALLAE